MKKIITLIMIFSFLLFMPQLVFATSGTCSQHGGVNCNAGADWDGSAICNDGWRDSSEMYNSQSICGNRDYCTIEILERLENKYNFNNYQERIDEKMDESDELYKLWKNNGGHAGDELIVEAQMLLMEAERIQDEQSREYKNIERECNSIGMTEWYQKEIEKEQAEYQRKREEHERDMEILEEYVEGYAAILNCEKIKNSIYKDGKCNCKEGYLYYKDINACKTPRQDCLDRYENVYWNDEEGKCKCKEGYYFEEAINNCFIKTEIQKENNKEQKQENNNNHCNDNQTLFNNRCIEIPENAHVIDSPTEAWSCNEGYEEINNSCVLVENKIEKIEDNIPLIENNNDNNDLIVGENVQEEVEIEPITPPKENKIKSFFKNIFNTIFSWFK